MVDGLDVKYSMMLVTVTMFFYITAMLNPIIKLHCDGPNCRNRMQSVFDSDFGIYDNYANWRNGTANLQSDGNVTLMRFHHGYVKCDHRCKDCEGVENASEMCTDYDDTEYQLLLLNLTRLNDSYSKFNHTHLTENDETLHKNWSNFSWTIPGYLVPNCECREWCKDCSDLNLVSLPGDKYRHVQNYWNELEKDCLKREEALNSTEGVMCDMFQTFWFTMALTLTGFGWLGAVLLLMMFMEYTNFHIFYGGKLKCCFISIRVKKALFTVLLSAPVTFMLYIWIKLRHVGDTEEMLTKYFDLIEAQFVFDWKTRGVYMFWISMALGTLSVMAMMMAGKTTRHLRTIIDYRRGVEYKDGNWKPHSS